MPYGILRGLGDAIGKGERGPIEILNLLKRLHSLMGQGNASDLNSKSRLDFSSSYTLLAK